MTTACFLLNDTAKHSPAAALVEALRSTLQSGGIE
jgi:hypothetical protein